MNKKKKELTPEETAQFEKETGVKVLDVKIPLIEYEGKRCRPIRNEAELMCAAFDNEPILRIGETQWVDEKWKP